MTEAPLILADHVSFTYTRPPVQALSNISFAVRQGSFTAIIGPNGSGKTTLLHLLLGLERPDSGEIRIGGRNVTESEEDIRRLIGYVPQHSTINGALPVRNRDIVKMGLSAREEDISKSELDERVTAALGMVDLADLSDRRYNSMSGGQQQRVLIARALAVNPTVLLLDEPFSAMDLAHQGRTAALLHRLVQTEGLTILFVAHNLNTLVHFLDDILLLNRKLVAFGPPDDVLKPEVLRQAYGANVPVFICEEGFRHPLMDSAHG